MAQPIRDLRQLAFVPRGLRHAVSRAIGNPVRMASAPYRYLTAARRLEPQFAIIGGQKCGTTSLYAYLLQHPRVVSLFKEVHFFDNNYYKGRRWYRAQFPLADAPGEDALITFDASPYYLFHPAAPQRVAALYPDMKLIALLRDPVDRAYSHYSHNRQSTAEKLSFEDAIRAEDQRLAGEEAKLLSSDRAHSYNHRQFSYLARGCYADQLERWLRYFPRERLLVLESEAMFRNPQEIFKTVLDFVGLEIRGTYRYEVYNPGRYADALSAETRAELQAYFCPHNERLNQLLGQRFSWS